MTCVRCSKPIDDLRHMGSGHWVAAYFCGVCKQRIVNAELAKVARVVAEAEAKRRRERGLS